MDRTENVRDADKLRARLEHGLIAAVPVPLDVDGRLHAAGHESYLTYLSAQPVAGAAVWAHTGRGLALDAETAAAVLADWRGALADRVVIAGAGAPSTEAPERATSRSIQMAERA